MCEMLTFHTSTHFRQVEVGNRDAKHGLSICSELIQIDLIIIELFQLDRLYNMSDSIRKSRLAVLYKLYGKSWHTVKAVQTNLSYHKSHTGKFVKRKGKKSLITLEKHVYSKKLPFGCF